MKLFLVLALVIQATIAFSATPQDGGVYKIVPKGSGQVLGVSGNSNDVGADIVGQPDQSSNYQRFILHQESPNVFFIEIAGNGLYVSNYVSPPRQANFNPDAFYQDYELIPAAGGYYMIRPVANQNNVLTIAPGGGLSWQPKTGADNQLFFFCSSNVIPSNGTAGLKLAGLGAGVDNENYEGIDLRP